MGQVQLSRMFGEMRLNGKIYLKKVYFEELIDDVMLELELLNFTRISQDLADLTSTDVDGVLKLLNSAKTTIVRLFDKERYIDVDSLIESVNDLMYDPGTEDVALYKYGAYGIKTRAPDEVVRKYAFNVCFGHLKKQIKKTNNL